MIINDTNKNGLGRIKVDTLSLPDVIKPFSATYTWSGKVLVSYRNDGDHSDRDYQHIAVVNDDGSGFKTIFSGVIRQKKTANGIRFMAFQDNRRVLLGDYVLECSPDIDRSENAVLVPVAYPQELCDDPKTTRHWSEIIIAPDNTHIAWTLLRSDIGAASAIGILERREDRYIVTGTQIISTLESFKKDTERPGYIIPQVMRGGELKQFVRGGAAISLVGAAKGSCLTDSVIQDLCSEEMLRITNSPGYNETTILSPDEKLGIVMSTRFSPKTDPAIFGLLPRPPYVTMGIIQYLYVYAVSGVRNFRKGNIGPVLIDIERSMGDKNYRGLSLHDPAEEWVYYSPMSWRPGGTKALWPEGLRGNETWRIRIAELLDYVPGTAVAGQKTPDEIPYAEKDLTKLRSRGNLTIEGKIAGLHSGHIEFKRQGTEGLEILAGLIEAVYVNFSDDGKKFYTGYERAHYSYMDESVYEADLVMSGEEQGEMKFRAAFSKLAGGEPLRLLFEKAADGKPKSYGYAAYKGVTLNIEDMLE